MNSLCKASQAGTQEVCKSANGYEVSLYKKIELTPEVLATELRKLRAAFPANNDDFFDLLTERLVALEFSDDRLRDAVANLLDNFHYKHICIADVVGYDRKTKLYTYGEMCNEISSQAAKGCDFELIDVNGRKFWIKSKKRK